MPRPYQQRNRADTADRTRRRIIAAGREVLAAGGTRPLRLGAVAERAGVARSTIYATMGGTAGLVQAVAQDLLSQGGFEVLQQALARPDPRAAMRELLGAGLRLWASQRPVVRGMYALARVDADVAAVVAQLDAGQRSMFETLAARLASPQATALLAVLGSFDTYELLARDFAMDPEQIIELLVTTADRAVGQNRS